MLHVSRFQQNVDINHLEISKTVGTKIFKYIAWVSHFKEFLSSLKSMQYFA